MLADPHWVDDALRYLIVGRKWKQFSFPLSSFNGTDGHDVRAIPFVGGPQAGEFDFQIADVQLR